MFKTPKVSISQDIENRALYPRVSIIFPNYNGGDEPLKCLRSIHKLNYPKDKLEIIVVDNGSKDGSDLKIRQKFAGVKLIKNHQNLGFARAINQGVKIAKGHLIFITNDDIIFEKNSLKNSVDYLLDHPDVGIVGGKIYFKNLPEKISSCGYIMNKWTGHILPAPNPKIEKEPDWVQGCAILISKKLLNKIDNLDPNYFFYFDDFDLCYRVRDAGFKVVYFPQAVFWHDEGKTSNKYKHIKYLYWYRGKIYFLIKHLPILNIASILLLQTLVVAPYRALVSHDKTFVPLLKALLFNIQNIKQPIIARKKLHGQVIF